MNLINNKNHNSTKYFTFAFILFWSFNFSFAQNRTLAPKYNPVVIKGSAFSDSLKIEAWTMFVWDAQIEAWQAIPFQMDEINGKGEFLIENDGFLGTNDELLFMANDAGDKAAANLWPDFSDRHERFEIELIDSVNPGQKGWVYLFKNITNKPIPSGYFQYFPSLQNISADTIQTRSYKLGHNNKGWTDFVSVSYNWSQDLIDRIKFHINGGGSFGIPEIYLTEDTLTFKTEEFFIKPIRSFQKVKTKLFFQIPPFIKIDKEDDFIISYYPYSTDIGAGFSVDSGSRYLLALLKIQNIRLSIDLSPEIKNMFFSSVFNQNGFPIDGNPENPNIILPNLNDINWVMASGAEGTILALFNFPDVQGAKGKYLYHRDNLNGGTNEGTEDTGDKVSFGDIGLWLQGDALVPKSSSLYVSLTTFYINEANKDAGFGNQILEEVKNPLQTQITYQTEPTSVNDRIATPEDFFLYNVYPNPFQTGKGAVVFRCRLAKGNQSGVFTIFNLLGQIVTEISLNDFTVTNGIFEYRWDGFRKDGSFLPAGVYFYQIKIGDHIRTKKMLLM